MDPLSLVALVLFIAMLGAWTMLPGSVSTTAVDSEVSVLPSAQHS